MTAAGILALLEPIQARLRRDTGTVAAPTDTARLLAAVKAVTEMHRPVKQTCGESHTHTMNESERCPTVSAVESALRGEA